MISIALITYRLVVLRFYRKNFAVFLVLGILVFGIIQPPYFVFTQEFAKILFENGYLIATISILGALYTFWINHSLTRYAKHPDHEYLQVLPALGKGKSFALEFWLSVGLQTPLIVYFITTTIHGFSLGSPFAFLTLGLCILYVLLPAVGLHRYMFNQGVIWKSSILQNLPALFRRDRVFLLHMGHLFQSKPTAMILIKVLSVGSLIAFCQGFSPDDQNALPIDIVLALLVILHALLPYWIFRAEDNFMPFLRSLPFQLPQRFLQYVLVYFILMVPEICVLLGFSLTGKYSPILILNFSLTLLGVCLLAQSLMLTTKLSMIDYVKTIFGFFIIQFILLLLGVPLAVLGLAFLLGAMATFWRSYYKCEPTIE